MPRFSVSRPVALRTIAYRAPLLSPRYRFDSGLEVEPTLPRNELFVPYACPAPELGRAPAQYTRACGSK